MTRFVTTVYTLVDIHSTVVVHKWKANTKFAQQAEESRVCGRTDEDDDISFCSGLIMFMSPSVGRKNGPKRDDESQLILNSPSSDSEANSIINGNHQPSSSTIDVGFVFPKAGKLKTPVSQVSFEYWVHHEKLVPPI